MPYLVRSTDDPLVDELVRGLRPNGRRTVDFLVDLNSMVHERTRYVIRMEAGGQTPDETLEKKRRASLPAT
jgi:transglutaminase-like putative cysteine protease